jgi:ABC-2 type transport system ATP-binding protein
MDATKLAPRDRPERAAKRTGPGPLLEVSALVKRYGKTVAVDEASFSVEQGEIFGLLGPNGAGKTTTVSIASTLLLADSGSVRVGGYDVRRQANDARRLIGVVPQEVGLYITLSARENLEYYGGLHGLRGRTLRSRIEELLEVTGLSAYARKPIVAKFSGGMRRRLNLAAGLLHRPRLLLLDEPTVGVDPQSRAHIFEHIRHLNRAEGVTVVYTTHYMEEAESLCDRVAIMDHGRVVVCDTVQGLLESMSGTVFHLTLAEPSERFHACISGYHGVLEVNALGERSYQVVSDGQAAGLEAILGAVGALGVQLNGMDVSRPNLEQVFLKLTGRGLRDA